MPNHYLNQYCNIVNLTLKNQLQWNLNRNLYIFIQGNALKDIVWDMAAIFSQPECVNNLWMITWLYGFLAGNCASFPWKLAWSIEQCPLSCFHVQNRGNCMMPYFHANQDFEILQPNFFYQVCRPRNERYPRCTVKPHQRPVVKGCTGSCCTQPISLQLYLPMDSK